MVSWEVVHRATAFIAEEMGVALRRSALSPNIRERADHSCAVVDPEGNVVAQAEHIPVHLGSLRVGVKNLLKAMEEEGIELEERNMLFSNNPYITGTHLNDVTVVAPVYLNGRLVAYMVNKAHHVDVGGPTFGSINPQASTIYEEGLIIPPTKLVEGGAIRKDVVKLYLANVKAPEAAEGDLSAQVAANLTGVARVRELIGKYGLDQVTSGWRRSIEYARELVRRELEGWPRGTFEASDVLEVGPSEGDDVTIGARVTIGEGVRVELSAPPQVQRPLNAVFGVTYAASSFAIRSLMRSEVPVNEGLYSMINVLAPEGSMLNARPPAPVAGGNLETSQRIVDVILRALSSAMPDRVPAASSGTMMNVMIGGVDPRTGRTWAYYETIGGGSGARPNGDGVSAVHTNMTNTMNTPIEVAEASYPIVFTSYRVREGSGGRGKYRGGDGIVRSFRVTAPARLSIMASRFRHRPWGIAGGSPGEPARVKVVRADGRVEDVPPLVTVELKPGDEVIIETPGGGGYGPEAQRPTG